MRRPAAITAFALFLAVPLWAQHGGGHAGGSAGGGHASFGGGGGHASGGSFGGHAGGPGGGHISAPSGGFGVHVASGTREGGSHFAPRSSPPINRGFDQPLPTQHSLSRNFTRPPLASQRSSYRGPYLRDRFRGSRPGGPRFRGPYRNYGYYGYVPGCYGYGCWGSAYGYPWWYSSYFYDPWWWWDSSSDYDNSYQQDSGTADAMDQQNLEEQRILHQEEADGDQDAYAQQASGQQYEPEGAPVLPPTVLVFRDQHQQEIGNYAIVGPTLWNFAPRHTEKIPLAQLDLPATVKANDERGLSFRLPTAQ